MFLSESCTNSASWCSTACTVKHLRTSRNCANQSQLSHHGNIFDSPPDSSWSHSATDSAFMADRFSVWLARRSGIPCPAACGIWLLAGSFRQSLKTFLFATYWCMHIHQYMHTSFIRGITTMRYINRLFTYIFTYFIYLGCELKRQFTYEGGE